MHIVVPMLVCELMLVCSASDMDDDAFLGTHHDAYHSPTRCNTHTATHCNTLRHTATHCNTLQHTATNCNKLQHTATHDMHDDVNLGAHHDAHDSRRVHARQHVQHVAVTFHGLEVLRVWEMESCLAMQICIKRCNF